MKRCREYKQVNGIGKLGEARFANKAFWIGQEFKAKGKQVLNVILKFSTC